MRDNLKALKQELAIFFFLRNYITYNRSGVKQDKY